MSADPTTPLPQAAPQRQADPVHPPLSASDRRRNLVVAMTGLVAVWVLLWGTFTWLNLISGVVVAAVLLAVFPLPPVTFAGRLHPLGLLRFGLRFLRDLVVASAQIAWLAVRFGQEPRSAIIGVQLRVNTDLNLTLTAEALSLVPGSLIVEVDRSSGTLYIHVLGLDTIEEVEQFRRSVLELEQRIIAAIGSPEEQRQAIEATHTGTSPPDGPVKGTR